MNSVELLIGMGDIGWRFKRKDIPSMMNYFDKMIEDKRILIIAREGNLLAVMAFSMCFDYETYLKKGEWEFKEHDRSGDIIYIEKLISLYWNKEMRYEFENIITAFYPNIKYGVWHRWAKWGDRKVVYKRRIQNVRN